MVTDCRVRSCTDPGTGTRQSPPGKGRGSCNGQDLSDQYKYVTDLGIYGQEVESQ